MTLYFLPKKLKYLLQTKNWKHLFVKLFTVRLSEIYEFREFGLSYRGISNFFNENKIRSTRCKSFSPSRISQIIKKNENRLKRR